MFRTKEVTIPGNFEESMEAQFEHYSQICCTCVGYDENKNLSGPQK